MTWPIGVEPPLHRKFDKHEAMEMVRNRYRQARRMIPQQIENLQGDEEFRNQCRRYYEARYKDWVIINAVLNCMLQWQAEQLRLDFRNPRQVFSIEGVGSSLEEIGTRLDNTTYPTWRFADELISVQMKAHSLHALVTYGFEPRRADFKPEVVERFLQERMKHFDFDLPHDPLFGEPPGAWPDTEVA